MSFKLIVAGAFALQTLVVYASNSRIFGLLKSGSGWYSNVEMSKRYTSLVTPATWAFAIWSVIYLWEIAAIATLAIRPTEDFSFWQGSGPGLWVAGNLFQVSYSCSRAQCAYRADSQARSAGSLGATVRH